MLCAGVAAHAGSSVLRTVFSILSRHIGIRHKRTAHGNEVRPAVRDDLLCIIEAHDTAYRVNKQVGITLFDTQSLGFVDMLGYRC